MAFAISIFKGGLVGVVVVDLERRVLDRAIS
jgi:hypothetical protein